VAKCMVLIGLVSLPRGHVSPHRLSWGHLKLLSNRWI